MFGTTSKENKMDKPISIYWEKRLTDLKTALESNNFEVFVADNKAEAHRIVIDDIMPPLNARTISWGGSMTFTATGLYTELKHNSNLEVLDTFDKKAGSIRRILNVGRLSEFIVRAQKNSLYAVLAGSLRAQDVDALASLGPNILGFRGALCLDSDRTFAIDERAVAGLRSRLDAVHAAGSRAVG